ncbi:hypothetical protein B7463_g10268, partial [Scytalidium lignicola]
MKFLCLHGSYGSATNFQVQLAPFVEAVNRSCDAQFKWAQGAHPATPPPGFEDYFGVPPLYRFVDFDGISGFNDILLKIHGQEPYPERSIRNAINDIFKIIDADPEIDGILGYSEGATTAATLILEERRRWEEEGIPRRIKCAIFFAGWPPVEFKGGEVKCRLMDECEDVIDIPTCHIVGCNDPYIHGAMALYNICDEDIAELFDHGKGHTVPRDARTINELAAAIGRVVNKASRG